MNDSEAIASYLNSLGSGGQESQKERDCLARIALWEGLAGFCEEMGKSDRFYCGNLQVDLTIGLCNAARREAKRRALAWPEGLGWLAVCHECPVRATIIPPNPPLRKGGDKDHRLEACATDACATNGKRQTANRKRLLKGMTRAVARDLGLI